MVKSFGHFQLLENILKIDEFKMQQRKNVVAKHVPFQGTAAVKLFKVHDKIKMLHSCKAKLFLTKYGNIIVRNGGTTI